METSYQSVLCRHLREGRRHILYPVREAAIGQHVITR